MLFTLPEANIAPETMPSQKENNRLPNPPSFRGSLPCKNQRLELESHLFKTFIIVFHNNFPRSTSQKSMVIMVRCRYKHFEAHGAFGPFSQGVRVGIPNPREMCDTTLPRVRRRVRFRGTPAKFKKDLGDKEETNHTHGKITAGTQ